jgi:23S rRNA (uracil1939-C5)-methyltransferase
LPAGDCYLFQVSDKRLAIGDRIEVTTEQLAYGGEAVARHQGLTIFVQGAAPHEQVRVRITEAKKNYARAVVEEILRPSSVRREPPCPYFGDCGGCQLQHLTYAAQLKAKANFIRDALNRIGRLDWRQEIEMRSAEELSYRSRAQLKIEGGQNKRIGYYRAASHSVCDVEDCPILLPQLNDTLHTIRAILKEDKGNQFHNLHEIEIAAGTNSVAVEPAFDPRLQTPDSRLSTEVAGAIYHYNATSFFQVNALLLDEFVREATADVSGNLAIDLYAGVGLFTIQLVRQFNSVIGIEASHRAVEFARENAAINQAENVQFITERADVWLRGFAKQQNDQAPDLLLLDPPRSGAAECMEAMARLKPRRIHYVSCDPTTLARDLKTLVAAGYRLNRVVGFDLFPQTYHIETIAFLSA